MSIDGVSPPSSRLTSPGTVLGSWGLTMPERHEKATFDEAGVVVAWSGATSKAAAAVDAIGGGVAATTTATGVGAVVGTGVASRALAVDFDRLFAVDLDPFCPRFGAIVVVIFSLKILILGSKLYILLVS